MISISNNRKSVTLYFQYKNIFDLFLSSPETGKHNFAPEEQYRSLLIVRNPIDRIYSAFREKIYDRKRM